MPFCDSISRTVGTSLHICPAQRCLHNLHLTHSCTTCWTSISICSKSACNTTVISVQDWKLLTLQLIHWKREQKHLRNLAQFHSLHTDTNNTSNHTALLKHQGVLLLVMITVSVNRTQAEGGHNSQGKNTLHFRVVCMFILIAGEQCCSNTTHGMGLWLSGTVCPC